MVRRFETRDSEKLYDDARQRIEDTMEEDGISMEDTNFPEFKGYLHEKGYDNQPSYEARRRFIQQMWNRMREAQQRLDVVEPATLHRNRRQYVRQANREITIKGKKYRKGWFLPSNYKW